MVLFKYKKITALFVVLSLLYVVQAIVLSPDEAALEKYHLSATQAIILGLTVTIPYVVIWFIALTGYLRFRGYTDSIAKSKDGAAFKRLSWGIFGLTIWLPVSAILSSLFSRLYREYPDFTAPMVQVKNYVILVLLFVSFLLIYQGAHRLLALVKNRPPFSSLQILSVVIFIVMATFYIFVTLNDPARQVPVEGIPVASYYLPDWLIVVTIIIPRIVMWYLGFMAVQFLYIYRRGVKGVIYQAGLHYLATGLAFVVITNIALRYMESLPAQLSNLSLGPILLLIYFLLALISAGYILISKGARRLQRIEEI